MNAFTEFRREPALRIGEARRIISSLSFPTKLPGSSYGLPAKACITGAKLAKIPGTACSTCYAMKDQYAWPNAQTGQYRRLASLSNPRWVEAMVTVLRRVHAHRFRKVDLGLRPGPKMERNGGRYRLNEMGWHRWHDSGDLQSAQHLANIIDVATQTPAIRHWLPTQELGFVKSCLGAGAVIPGNLIIRVSTVMLDEAAPRAWPTGSTVFTKTPPKGAHVCPAPRQGMRCMDCRACWNRDVNMIAYGAH